MRAQEPGMAYAFIVLYLEGPEEERVVFAQEHPGDGEWHRLSVHAAVPAEARVKQVDFTIQLRKTATRPAQIADFDVQLIPAL